jgi:hypothetical protein
MDEFYVSVQSDHHPWRSAGFFMRSKLDGMTLRTFLRLPTLVEWVVIVLVILIGMAVLLPNFPIDFDKPPPRPARSNNS